MPSEIVPLVFLSLAVAFVVLQLGKTRGVIPLVAGIGAAVFSYTRYSTFAGFLGQPRLEGTFDSQITYLQYFWLGSIPLWIVVAGWGLARVLGSAPPGGGAGNLRERVKAVTSLPTEDEEVVINASVLKMDAWGLEDDVIVEKIVDPRSGVALSPSEMGQMPKRKFRIIPTLKGAGAGALGGGLIASLPLVLLVLFGGGDCSEGAAWGLIFAIAAGAIGASIGAVAGGVTANTTTTKGKGASLGARVGTVTGAIGTVVLSMKPGNYFDYTILVGVAAVGAMAGAAAGFLGSVVAKHTTAAHIHDERRGR